MPTMKMSDGTLMGWTYSSLTQDHFPTEFCKSILASVGLFNWDFFVSGDYHKACKTTCPVDHAECYWFEACYTAARDFQRMAMGCTFDRCLLCYHGFDLKENQLNALRIVHEATPAYLLGRTLDNAVVRMDRDKTSNKDFGLMLQVVMEQITLLNNMGTSDNGGSKNTESLQRLIINVQAQLGDGQDELANIETIPGKNNDAPQVDDNDGQD